MVPEESLNLDICGRVSDGVVFSCVHSKSLKTRKEKLDSKYFPPKLSMSRRIIFPVLHDNTASTQSMDSSSCQTQHGDIAYFLPREKQESDELETRSNLRIVSKQPGHYYQLASSPRYLEQCSNSSSEKVVADLPTSVLRRKTRCQSSLLINSEDGHSCIEFEGPRYMSPPSASSSSSLQSLSVSNNTLLPPAIISTSCPNTSTSSMPSLVSSNSWCSNECYIDCLDIVRPDSMCSCMKITKSVRHKCVGVSFDPRIWVFEYEQDKEELEGYNWYTAAEIEEFKRGAIACIKEQETRYLSDVKLIKVFFNHPAPASGYGTKIDTDHKPLIQSCNNKLDMYLKAHIKHILVVDPNKLFLSLFKKGFEHMLPHVSVTTANSSEMALKEIQTGQDSGCNLNATHGFDIVVIEERLLPTIAMQQQFILRHKNKKSSIDENIHSSGSYLIQRLASEREEATQESTSFFQGQISQHTPYTLLIGVSAHENDDHSKLSASGADIVWKKPPPSMDQSLRNELLHKIFDKRSLHLSVN